MPHQTLLILMIQKTHFSKDYDIISTRVIILTISYVMHQIFIFESIHLSIAIDERIDG